MSDINIGIDNIDRYPVPNRDKGRPTKYPWRELQIGQSFFAPSTRVNTAIWSRKTGFRYTQRHVRECGSQGIRVWRIA
jgi:hypothetical protein